MQLDPILLGLLAAVNALVALYFVPTAIAVGRGVRRAWLVALLNVVLGWTAIVWILVLMHAVRADDPRPESRETPVLPPAGAQVSPPAPRLPFPSQAVTTRCPGDKE